MKKLSVMLIAVCLFLSGCFPAGMIPNDTYFDKVLVEANDIDTEQYGIGIFSNTIEDDVPYAEYTTFKILPASKTVEETVSKFSDKKIKNFCCLLQVETASFVEIKIYGLDWTKIFSQDKGEILLGSDRRNLLAGDKICLEFNFEYDLSGYGSAQEDEWFSGLDEDKKFEWLQEKLSTFFIIKVDGGGAKLRLDSFIFVME